MDRMLSEISLWTGCCQHGGHSEIMCIFVKPHLWIYVLKNICLLSNGFHLDFFVVMMKLTFSHDGGH